MLEKNNPTTEVDAITFNWERVKKKASSKRDELVNNSPQVVRRTESAETPPMNTIAHTSTTDTLTDPYANIAIQAKSMPSSNTPKPAPSNSIQSPPSQRKNPYNNTIYKDDNNNNINPSIVADMVDGTYNHSLLPAAPAQGGTTPCDQLLGPERNAVELLQGIKSKDIAGSELTMDERRLVVKSMKELGQTQDAIAALLKVSRRTIVNDYRALRHEQALAIQSTDTNEIAGEVYSTARTCIRRALQAGSFKTVSVIMRDMVEVLQSLGVLYRAPKTSMQASLHGDIPGRHNGYHKYIDGIAGDKTKVVEVLDCMFDAIGKDEIPEL